MLEFHIPSEKDRDLFLTESKYLAYEYYYSYSVIWGDAIGLTICKTDTALYMHLAVDDVFLMPVTDNMQKAMQDLEEHCKQSGQRFQLECVPTEQALEMEKLGYTIEHIRNLDDYVYESDKLIKLSGRKLQSKRNHISQFERKYTYSVRPLRTEQEREECYRMASTTWLENHDEGNEDIKTELGALRRTFDNWDHLGLVGILICVDHHLTAFTVGEIIDNNLAIVHFEKGDTSYIGIYSVINQLFCSMYLSDVHYINRQEDAGVEGLRKAKLSYRPDIMVEKYRIVRKP
ncbi:phosphatidylglycerol lysyltransferase domain-containing protein [Sphaerochaeta sp. PS]|uniref:DUF2156 domain-containing protein n=1 Tax=Sphaerochaeta sp. PS TaxID=3076336 RepID=UPI0028A38CD3|nr:phosphatidylglycerol lysyltransferase domain-containing protein [Sphaerochaeta sp. PS]MDT4763169.1 phosphatidylglycerol lysyltransferase domain-containing protein [Sphaerochaeta sp. PS]